MEYKKNHNPEMDRDYEAAAPYGKVRVGDKWLYWKKFLTWNALDYSEAARMYRRLEDVSSRTSCCRQDFSVHKLMVILKDGEQMEILIGEGLYRGEPERLMEELQRRHPEIPYGKPADN